MLSYKEPSNFRKNISKSLNGTILLGSTIKTDGDSTFDEADLDCQNKTIIQWEEMMQNGSSPLKEIKSLFQDQVPIFDPHFLYTTTLFVNFFPKKGIKVLDYILYGPLHNISILNWKYIYGSLFSFLPYTINTIAHSLFIQETADLHHREIFLEMGGLSLLYPYAKDNTYQNNLSLILKFLSSYKLSEYKLTKSNQQKKQFGIFLGNNGNDSITDFVNKSSSFGIEIGIDTEEDNESAFIQFCESLLLSENLTVRLNTLGALLSLTESDLLSRDFISRIVISHIDKIQGIEELTFILKILANSLNSQITPFISHLGDIINQFIETADSNLIDAFCAFIENLIHREDIEYIWSLGIVNKIANIISIDSPFHSKKNLLIILIKIANACDPATLKEVISIELLVCLIDFLNLDNDAILIGILSIIFKIVNYSQSLNVPLDYLHLISSEANTFINLLNSNCNEIRNLASDILSFIEFYSKREDA